MKIFVLDTPWDYHEYGQVLVMAETATEAAGRLREKYPVSKYGGNVAEYVQMPNLEQRLREYDEDIYENQGCDC